MTPRQLTKSSAISEATLVERWLSGPRGLDRTEDGRSVRVVFPGVRGGGEGPDVRDAVLELAGDMVRGDVEVHLRSRGWYEHGHNDDPRYANVVLHLVGENNGGSLISRHRSGRAIPIAVTAKDVFPTYSPPCTRHSAPKPVLEILGLERVEAKAVAVSRTVVAHGAAQALYENILRIAGGPPNADALENLGRMLPLAALLERVGGGPSRSQAIAALLIAWAERFELSTRGRPASHPVRRLSVVAELVARLWPENSNPAWPPGLRAGPRLPAELKVPGLGQFLLREIVVNAVLPVGIAAGAWRAEEAADVLKNLASPGIYGRLRRLETWLKPVAEAPFATAGALQGALRLHETFCARGYCGRCPLSAM